MASIKKTRSKLPIGVVLSTLFIAVFCDIKAINSYLVLGEAGDIGESETGMMTYLYMLSVAGALLAGVLFNHWRRRRVSAQVWFITIWVSLFYFFTAFFIGSPFTSLIMFAVLTVISFMLPSFTKIDGRLLLKSSMLLSVPAVFSLEQIFHFANDYSEYITMGQSYAFLYPVVASIVYFFLYFKKESMLAKILTIILFAVNGVYAYYLISFGSRGPVLSILAVIVFCLVFRHSEGGFGVKMLKSRFAVVTAVAVVAAFSFLSLMQLFQGVLGDYGQSLYFVDKFLQMEAEGDITNGRQWIYATALSDIGRNPIFGMGFDQFNNNHGASGITYPHNFILQTLYDGGVVLLLVLSIPVIIGLVRMWKNCTLDEYAVIVAMAFSAVPRAMFSGDLWQNGHLWMFFGILLCNGFVLNRNINHIINNNERISKCGRSNLWQWRICMPSGR